MWQTRFTLALAVALVAASSCSTSHEPVVVDTNSNWLKRCDSSVQCGEGLSCVCSICTERCRQKEDCEAYSSEAVCESAADVAFADECGDDEQATPAQICVLPCTTDADCAHLGKSATCTGQGCFNQAPLTPPTEPAWVSCEPLAEVDVPLQLGALLAAGRDAEGTIYAVYEAADGHEEVLLVSEGEALYRREIVGSGAGTDGDNRDYMFSFKNNGDGSVLLIEIDASSEMRMAVVPDEEYEGRIEEMPETGELLDVLAASDVEHMQKENLPGVMSIEYLAEVENGDIIVVVVPKYDWSYEDFELYYGTPEEMRRCEVSDVLRARDGGSTSITFEKDGSTAEVFFPVNMGSPGAEWEGATLNTGDREYAVTRLAEDAMDVGEFAFVCRREASSSDAAASSGVVAMDIPAGACDGCYLVNAGVWGFSASDIYVVGYVSRSSQSECSCEDSGFVKHFDGRQWSTLYEATQWRYVHEAWASSPTDIYVIGDEGLAHYDGRTLEIADAPPYNYSDIWGTAENAVFAVGEGGTIVEFDGDSWRTHESETSAHLTGLWGDAADNVFALADDGEVLHYAGQQWVRLPMIEAGDLEPEGGLNAVWGSSPDRLYGISGSDHPDGSTGPGAIYAYDGQEWSRMQDAEQDALLAITGTSADLVFAVGASRDADSTARAVVWRYDGEQWERTLLEDAEAFLWDVWCSPAGDCFASGTDNTFLSLNE